MRGSAWAVRRRLMAARCVYGFSRRRQTASLITAARGERLTRSRRRRHRGGSRWELSAVGRKTFEKARVSHLRQQGGGNFCHFLPQYIYFFLVLFFVFRRRVFVLPLRGRRSLKNGRDNILKALAFPVRIKQLLCE